MTIACKPKTGECHEVRNFITPKGQIPRPLRKWNINNKDVPSGDSTEDNTGLATESQELHLSGEGHHVDDGGI